MNMTSSLAEHPQTQETTPESQRVSGTVEGSPLAPEMLSVLCLSKLGRGHEFPYSRTHGTDIVLINCNVFHNAQGALGPRGFETLWNWEGSL
jgi:hypothetical protein